MPDIPLLPNHTTQDRFLSALFLLMEHKEYHEISIVDICKEAELSAKHFIIILSTKMICWIILPRLFVYVTAEQTIAPGIITILISSIICRIPFDYF